MATAPKRVVILGQDEHTGEIHTNHRFFVLDDMINVAKAKKKEIFAICITGVYRSGKSFLLNLLHLYLEYLSQHGGNDDGWENQKDKVIKGVNWAGGQTAVTMGISMWIYPKLIHGKGVLLIDCQGTGDSNRSTKTLDHLILSLGLQLSDVLILNMKGRITADDMDRLQLCAAFADDPEKEKIFEHLVCLVRDWEDTHKPHSIKEMLESAQNKTIIARYQGILKAFKSTEVTGLEAPGKRFGRKNEADGVTIGDVEPEFIMGVKSVFQHLIRQLQSTKTKYTGEEFLNQFKILGQKPIVILKSPQEEAEEMAVRKAFEDTKCLLEERLRQLLASEDERSKRPHHVKAAIAAAFDEELQKFLNSNIVASHALPAQKTEYERCLRKVHIRFVEDFDRDEKERAAERKREQLRKQEYERVKFEQAQTQYQQVVEEKQEANQEYEEMQLVQLHAMRFLRLFRGNAVPAGTGRQGFVEQDSDEEDDEEFQPMQVKALWDYSTQEEDELEFSSGDIILMLREIDESWAYGMFDGAVGFFPHTFCERI